MITEREFERAVKDEAFLADPPWEVTEDGEGGFKIGSAGADDNVWLHPEIEELELEERLKAWARVRNTLPGMIEFVRRAVAHLERCSRGQPSDAGARALLADWRPE